MSQSAPPSRPRGSLASVAPHLLLGVAAAAVIGLYLFGLDAPFGNSDEVIYAEFVRAMHRTGDYLETRYGDGVVHQRPVAPIALYALVSRAVPGEGGLRLLPALCTALVCLVACLAARRRFGRVDAGLVALLLTAGAPTVYVFGRLLTSDPPFVLACTLALAATMAAQHRPRWFPWACVALGATFATKSLAGAVALVALAPWLARAWHRHRASPALRPALGIAGFFLVAAPYYVAGVAVSGRRFVEGHLVENIVLRAAGRIEILTETGPGFYVRHLAVEDGFPLLLPLLLGVVGALVLGVVRRDVDLLIPATSATVTLAVLSALGSRTGHYLLPFYPAAAISAAGLVARLVPGPGEGSAVFRAPAPAFGLALVMLTVADPGHDPQYLPAPETLEAARVAREVVPPGERVYALDWYGPALGYYADRRWGLLTTSPRAARAFGAIDVFRNDETVRLVPPWPGGAFVVAAGPRALDQGRRSGLRIERVIARLAGLSVVEARGESLPGTRPSQGEPAPGGPTLDVSTRLP